MTSAFAYGREGGREGRRNGAGQHLKFYISRHIYIYSLFELQLYTYDRVPCSTRKLYELPVSTEDCIHVLYSFKHIGMGRRQGAKKECIPIGHFI